MASADEKTSTCLDWLPAHEAYSLVRRHNGQRARFAIAARAHVGLVRTRSRLFNQQADGVNGRKRSLSSENVELPLEFWWARGEASLEQDWKTGDFSTWIDKRYLWEAFGVEFCRDDIEEMLATVTTAEIEQSGVGSRQKRPGGRRPAQWWPHFAEELAVYIHKHGVPESSGVDGQDELINAVFSSMSEQGNDPATRTTVQPVIRQVIKRIRGD